MDKNTNNIPIIGNNLVLNANGQPIYPTLMPNATAQPIFISAAGPRYYIQSPQTTRVYANPVQQIQPMSQQTIRTTNNNFIQNLITNSIPSSNRVVVQAIPQGMPPLTPIGASPDMSRDKTVIYPQKTLGQTEIAPTLIQPSQQTQMQGQMQGVPILKTYTKKPQPPAMIPFRQATASANRPSLLRVTPIPIRPKPTPVTSHQIQLKIENFPPVQIRSQVPTQLRPPIIARLPNQPQLIDSHRVAATEPTTFVTSNPIFNQPKKNIIIFPHQIPQISAPPKVATTEPLKIIVEKPSQPVTLPINLDSPVNAFPEKNESTTLELLEEEEEEDENLIEIIENLEEEQEDEEMEVELDESEESVKEILEEPKEIVEEKEPTLIEQRIANQFGLSSDISIIVPKKPAEKSKKQVVEQQTQTDDADLAETRPIKRFIRSKSTGDENQEKKSKTWKPAIIPICDETIDLTDGEASLLCDEKMADKTPEDSPNKSSEEEKTSPKRIPPRCLKKAATLDPPEHIKRILDEDFEEIAGKLDSCGTSVSTSTDSPIEPPGKRIRLHSDSEKVEITVLIQKSLPQNVEKIAGKLEIPEENSKFSLKAEKLGPETSEALKVTETPEKIVVKKPYCPTIDLTTEPTGKSPVIFSPRRSLLISSLTKNLEKFREKQKVDGGLLKKALIRRDSDSFGEQKKQRQMQEKIIQQQQKLQEQHIMLQKQKQLEMQKQKFKEKQESQMKSRQETFNQQQQKGASRRKTGLGVLKIDCDAPPPPPPPEPVEKPPAHQDETKSEKSEKGEADRDVFDSLLDFKFVEGIAKLKFLGLYYGFSEYGFPELIPENEIKKGIKTIKRVEGRSRIWGRRSGTDDQFVCKHCEGRGSIKTFISPEYCSHECFKEVLNGKRDAQLEEDTKKESRRFEETKERKGKKKGAEERKRVEEKKRIEEEERKFKEESIKIEMEEKKEVVKLEKVEKLKIAKEPEEKFTWEEYLGNTTLVAPQSLFNMDITKLTVNLFEIDMALEAIDPDNQSLYCVVTVVQKLGYRIKLHFDGYPEMYDFWVNADSQNIFPTGYCCNTGRDLQPPPGYMKNFDWIMYLEATGKKEAPRHIFPHMRSENKKSNGFQPGMKLEVADKRRDRRLHIGTVIDSVDDRILIHYDFEDEVHNTWFKVDSSCLHPRDYHRTSKRQFVPPFGFEELYRNKRFYWEKYLLHSNGQEAPENIFKPRKPKDFKRGMKIECVDRVNPELLRPATIIESMGFDLLVCYDGFSQKHSYFISDDSPDIFPIKYSAITGHSIEMPANKTKIYNACGSPGCRGLGNALSNDLNSHETSQECPYFLDNWKNFENKKKERPLRLKPKDVVKVSKVTRRNIKVHTSIININESFNSSQSFEDDSDTEKEDQKSFKLEKSSKVIKKPEKKKLTENINKFIKMEMLKNPKFRATKGEHLKHSKYIFNELGNITKCPLDWTIQEVGKRITKLYGEKIAKIFVDNDVDGKCFLSLSKDDLHDRFKFNLGLTINIFNHILFYRADVIDRFYKVHQTD